jgi:hypothetical protein
VSAEPEFPYRQRHRACIHPETYKYFFARAQVAAVWARLIDAYGAPRALPSVHVVEIETPRLLLRATSAKNPITVIRKRACTDEDIARLHVIFEYSGGASGE